MEYDQTSEVRLTLKAKPGALFVVTTPAGADIYLDDRNTQQKSPAKLENLTAGEHRLRLTLEGYGEVVKNVIVPPNKTETLSETMTVTSKIAPGSTALCAGNTTQGPLTGMTFVSIPGGSFMMGSNESDDEKPIHRVDVKAFSMMTTEVTQQMWQELMGSDPSYFKGDNLPVEQVSWNDAQEFIKKLNQRDPGKGYRLPSEVEWEYACRGGSTTTYNTGDSESDLARAGWYNSNSDSKTHPVGQKTPNTWGLSDMHGNVWEWCEDWYHDSYSSAPSDGRAWLSPEGSYRVLRGGSWDDSGWDCRSSNRYRFVPDDRDYFIGFRLARSPNSEF